MATRGQRFHAEEQRANQKPKKKIAKKKPTHKKGEPIRVKAGTVGKKASYADEAQPAEGQPSRKSTRKSANHSKSDSNLTLREGRKKGSPEARFAKSRAKSTRVRGGGAAKGKA
jgi:hypothetical protein